MGAVFKREFKAIFHNIVGYIFMGLFLFAAGLLTVTRCVNDGQSNVEVIFSDMAIIAALLVPLLTVRMMLSEKKKSCERFISLMPLRSSEIILGKYFALLSVCAIPTAVMAVYFFILGFFGEINYMAAYIGLLMFFMLCAMLSAFYLFVAVKSRSVVKVSIVSYAVSFLVFVIGFAGGMLRAQMNGIFERIGSTLSPFSRIDDIIYGNFDFTTPIYFAVITVLFLLLSVQKWERKSMK